MGQHEFRSLPSLNRDWKARKEGGSKEISELKRNQSPIRKQKEEKLKYSPKTLMAGPRSCQGVAGLGREVKRRRICGEEGPPKFFLSSSSSYPSREKMTKGRHSQEHKS